MGCERGAALSENDVEKRTAMFVDTKSRNTLSTRRIVIDCIDLSHLFVIGRSLLLTSMSSLIYCTWSVFVNVDDVNIFTIVLKEKW